MRTALSALPLVALAVAISAQPVHAQQPPANPNPMQRAVALINAGQAAQAVTILDSVTTANPNAMQAWGLLGAALLSARQLDRAVSVLERVAGTPPPRPAVLYNLGLALALQGKMDSAFVRLHAAKATGLIDMTQLGTDPDAGPVRADARYRELVPTEAEYAAPFVEPLRILREWRGDAAGDQFGWIARDAGDVDGDRIHDVVTSAPTARNSAGVVYMLSSARGTRVWEVAGSAGDQLGLGVEAAGDVNADGVPDVIAGAPGGRYTLILSGRDGSVIHRLNERSPAEMFGRKVSDLGDVNGDGYADVMIGAPLSDAAGTDAGRVYVISGKTGEDIAVLDGPAAGERFGDAVGGTVYNGRPLLVIGAPGAAGGGRTYVFRSLSGPPAFTINADSTGSQLGGMFVSVVGDVDYDGTPDVYASDWNNTAKGPTTGRIYVHSGATGQPLHVLTGEGPGDGFGIGVADAGDVDADGFDDLIIGAWQFKGAAASGGKVYLHSGKDGHLMGELTGKVMGETLGFDATGVGDIDGDGVPDMLLTSAWSAVSGTKSGRVLIVSGAELMKRRLQ